VIKADSKPVVEVMTLITTRRKTSSDVARTIGALIVGGVAGVALRRKSLELTNGGALMTGIAIQRGVCAQQRESVGVIFDLLN
jgi:hypothetical protein